MRVGTALCFLVLAIGAAHAQDASGPVTAAPPAPVTPPPINWRPPLEIQKQGEKPAEHKPVSAYGDDHSDCAEWTDGCIVCKKQLDKSVACSMPGIACLPAATECLNTAEASPAPSSTPH
jgi:hypothetical protein